MDSTHIEALAKLRAVVGYLGEREQYAWWQSSFFAAGSRPFLTPIFSKTYVLAQCMGVTHAAGLVHDERIGVGRVYHLFRLPEDIEQGIHRILHTPAVAQLIPGLVAHKDTALEYLRAEARSVTGASVGPVEIGHIQDIRNPRQWRAIAAEYLRAFDADAQIYPYFRDRA